MTTKNLNQEFTEQSNMPGSFVIQKGQLNHYRLRPAILNEHVETAREIQGVVASGNIVGQIFQACQDNINGISLTLESAAGVIFDDFESYADTAALQAAWVASTARLPLLEETILPVGASTKAFSAPSTTAADEWVRTIVATDYTGYIAEMKARQTEAYAQQKIRFFVGDGTNTKSIPIVAPIADEYFEFEVKETDFTEDGGGTTNVAAITKVGYRVESSHPGSLFYIDDLTALPAPGSVRVKLFDMGTELPVTGVATLDDGDQYITLGDVGISNNGVHSYIDIELLGGKREYFVTEFIAGVALEIPSNVLLTSGNYYAIALEYVDTDVNVWGANTTFATKYYENGYAFQAASESAVMTRIGAYNDIHFMIFSTQPIFINKLVKAYNTTPGQEAFENIRVEGSNMEIMGIMAQNLPAVKDIDLDFQDRPFYMPKGGKFEVNHNDDFSDSTSIFKMVVSFVFAPPTING